MWDFGSSMAMSPNRGFPMTSTANPQAFALQLPTASSFSQSQPIVVPSPHYVQAPIHPLSHSIATPLFHHHSQAISPCREVRPPIYPIAGPLITQAPPPPSLLAAMPLSAKQPRDDSRTAALNSSLPLRYSPSEAKMCEEHYIATRKATTKGTDKQGDRKTKKMKGAGRDIGKHIQHVHFCAGCGRVRSKRYQKEHPLKRGQIPDRDYCTKCQREAVLAESDDADDTDVNVSHNETRADILEADHRVQNATEYHQTPTVTTNVSCTDCSKERYGKKACGSRKKNKSGCFSSSSSILTDSTVAEGYTMLPPSVSSAGESDVGVTASARGPKTGQHKCRRSKSLVGETAQKVDSSVPPLSPDASRENKEAILNNDTRMENSNPAANTEGDEPNIYANSACAPSKTPFENHSRFSQQPSPEVLPKTRPKISPQSVSDRPEVTPLYYDGHDEMNTSMYTDHYHRSIDRETQAPQATYSDDHYRNSRNKQPTNGFCKSVHEYNHPCESMKNSHVYEPQARAYATPRYEQPAVESEVSQRERSHRRRVRRHQDGGRAYRHEHGEGHMENAMGPETPCDPDYVSGWDLPPTPIDLSHAYQTTDPYFMGETWDANQGGEEELGQGYEFMAEEDLISAAKFFDDMTGPFCDSGTSSFPMPKSMTRTEISIESCYSRRGADGSTLPPAAYELYESSELDSTADKEESQAKTLEFSSKVDRDEKTARRTGSGASSTYYHRQKPRERQSESSLKLREENPCYSDERETGSSLDLSPRDPASSTIAHTGHSLEGLLPDLSDHAKLAVIGKRRRVRQLLGL
ncbi:uncharacterized protein F4807DRAFT_438886 [Annulohypoxylon truncatum]|uniref:uncharacterized protein n=1 Tax=Annulohypoxylon truncatum TaxID=327061 RepID=UPI0020082FD7|nr:uncharacterized protein F4807DRAFT_438886 [Annulohypoxylon truncatum]KAI1206401.1 hypothetical protein F4807DRAFT_438886 [Annulohypoxylon truncatum]